MVMTVFRIFDSIKLTPGGGNRTSLHAPSESEIRNMKVRSETRVLCDRHHAAAVSFHSPLPGSKCDPQMRNRNWDPRRTHNRLRSSLSSKNFVQSPMRDEPPAS